MMRLLELSPLAWVLLLFGYLLVPGLSMAYVVWHRRQLRETQEQLKVDREQLKKNQEQVQNRQQQLTKDQEKIKADLVQLRETQEQLKVDREQLKKNQGQVQNRQQQLTKDQEKIKADLEWIKAGQLRNSIGIEFVRIPAESFMMGSENGGNDDERPVHRVQISQPFYLGKYEVTQGQWFQVMGSNPSHFTGDPNRPVESISWDDVQAFIKRLNAHEGRELYRLPTEAEWEYAARAGTTTDYHFGNDRSQLKNCAWYRENSGDKTHPVGRLYPNAWGLHDMHGNVREWVQDWHGSYSTDSVTDPEGPSSGSYRVVRGGSWFNFAGDCRSAYRNANAPGGRLDNLGFRLLRTAP